MKNMVLRILLATGLCTAAAVTQAGEWRYSSGAGEKQAAMVAAATQMQEPAAKSTMAKPASTAAAMKMPHGGMKLDKVRSEFGPPQEEIPAVGQPPILRWRYPDYIVYFEYDIVITSVPLDI